MPVWLFVWALMIIINSAFMNDPLHARNYPELFLSPLNLEFILGAFVGLWLTQSKMRSSAYFFWIGLALFTVMMMVHLPGKQTLFNLQRVMAYGLPSAMIILGAVHLEQKGYFQGLAPLSRLGDWSYSLYLVHFLVLLTLRRLWQMADPHLPDGLQFSPDAPLVVLIFSVVAVFLSIFAAAVSYQLIEKPALRLLRRGQPKT